MVLCAKRKRFTAPAFIEILLPALINYNSSQTFWPQDPFPLFTEGLKNMSPMRIFTDNGYRIRNENSRAREMAPQLRTLLVYPEDMSSVPGTHSEWLTTTVAVAPAPGDLASSPGIRTYVANTFIHTHTETHTNK